MSLLRTIKSTALITGLLTAASVGTAAATPNTSSYSMQLSGNTVNVYATNSEAVNAVEADFAYSGSASSFTITPAVGSTFTTCVSQTSSSIACTILGSSASAGQHLVASLTFTPKAGVTNASVTVSMTSSSQVLAASDSTDTLNHTTLPSVTYAYTAPTQPTTPTPTQPGTTDSKTTGTGNGSSTTTRGGNASITTNTQTTTPVTSSDSKKDPKNQKDQKTNKYTNQQPHYIKNHHVAFVGSTLSLVVLGAAAYWLIIRKRPELAPAKVYKATSTATTTRKNTRTQNTTARKTRTKSTAKKVQPKKK